MMIIKTILKNSVSCETYTIFVVYRVKYKYVNADGELVIFPLNGGNSHVSSQTTYTV